jgi:hypothetical protein
MLKESSNLLVVSTNKNLGPAIIECATYIEKVYSDHLSDNATYQSISSGKAHKAILRLAGKIIKLVIDHHDELLVNHSKFLLNSIMEVKDTFPHFYLTFKIHKTPLKTRPTISVSGSLLHSLGGWLENQL